MKETDGVCAADEKTNFLDAPATDQSHTGQCLSPRGLCGGGNRCRVGETLARACVTGERGKVVYPWRKRGRARVSFERGRSRCCFIVIFRFRVRPPGPTYIKQAAVHLGSWRISFYGFCLCVFEATAATRQCPRWPAKTAIDHRRVQPQIRRTIYTENNASSKPSAALTWPCSHWCSHETCRRYTKCWTLVFVIL